MMLLTTRAIAMTKTNQRVEIGFPGCIPPRPYGCGRGVNAQTEG